MCLKLFVICYHRTPTASDSQGIVTQLIIFFLFTVLQTSVNLQSVDFWFPVGLNHACCRFCRFASFVSCRATVKTLTKAFATFVIPQNMYSKNKKLVCCGRGVTTRRSRFSQHAVCPNVLSRSHSRVCISMNTCCKIFQHAASCVLYWQVWKRGGAGPRRWMSDAPAVCIILPNLLES